ncbi:hypothetical protein CHLRE_01g026700v5 [Chlamydomonas reinhardtii]|uniref:Uncharacterized protein n=1 Tax=Chlamydomonas reinhardtii TaxID=3055 RepID=A0A2K3E6I0_CHLRE|nr:uncharacterized protein CHLRE_01g026700v5 [Chlamydomonas reinhardtii]PNW88374.1 hypothetical protein CHLRE_01g026700v5 [Chlamydomonas reinhardtii]
MSTAEGQPSSSCGSQAAKGPRKRRGGTCCAAARGGEAEKRQPEQYEEDEIVSEDPQQHQRQRRPLSFSRWFAREARATDVFMVLAEVLIINWLHAARLGEALHCGEGGAAAGSSSGTSSSGSSSSSSSGSSPFPCGGGLWSKLLWSLSSGAVLDPVLRLQMWDYSNFLYIWTQLAVVLIALLAPALYERCRHALMAGAGVAMLLGVHWSLWAAPPGPFPLNSCIMLSAQRRRIGCVYMGWKSATVFRVPASTQLVTGPLLWLLMAAALPMTDRRMPPPGSVAGGGGADGYRRLAFDTLLLFLSIAVLPYVLCRIWEARALRPAYQRYLRNFTQQQQQQQQHRGTTAGASSPTSSCGCVEEAGGVADAVEAAGSRRATDTAGTTAGASGLGARGSCGDDHDGSAAGSSSGDDDCSLAAAAWPSARQSLQASPAAGLLYRRSHTTEGGTPSTVAAGLQAAEACAPVQTAHASAAAHRSVLYRSHTKANGLLRRTRSALVSVKVPIQHRGSGSGARGLARSAVESSSMDLLSFEQASALVLRSAAGELNAHNATQAQRRLQAAAPAAVPLRCLSAVCVEGCVQLLMVVHFVTAGAEEEEAGGPQGEGQAAEGGGSPLHRSVHHVRLQPEQLSVAATGTGQVPKAVAGTSAAVTAEGAAGDAERAMAAAAAAAVQQLLAQIGAEVEQMSTAAGASAASASNCASITVASTAAPAFCWPPALPLLTTAPGDAPAGAEVGGAPGEGDEAVVVLLQLPAASGGGLRSVRCVLAGPAAVPPAPEPGGEGAGEGGRAGAAAAVAHMDVELPLRPLQQPLAGGEAGGGVETTVSAYVRLPVPPRVRMGAGGLRMMYVLPPLGHDTAAGTANAASAKESPFTITTTTTTIRPTWLAAEHGAEGTNAFPAASSLASAASAAAFGDGAGTYAESPAGANPSSVSTNATVNASADAAGTSSARSSMSGGPDSTAPLAVVPLLVVGSEAAAELHQLHGHVLGDEAVAQLHQLTTTAVAGAAVEAEGGSSHSAGEGLSGAAAALQHSGLTSLVLDFGALLQVPQSFAASGADADESAITESAAAAFVDLLRFLAAQRMAGCLREALAPLQRAGVQLPLSLGEDQDSAVAAATASGDGAVLHARRQTAAEDPLPSLAQAPDTAPACDVPGPCATAAKPAATAAAKPAAAAAAAESEAAVEAAAAAAATLPHLQLSGSTRSQLAWWVRVTALGFPRVRPTGVPASAQQHGSSSSQQPQQDAPSPQPLSPEAAYQDHKAATCRALDSMALVGDTAFRVVSLMRTCNTDAVPTPVSAAAAASKTALAATSAMAAYAARIRTAMGGCGLAEGLWRATQLVVGAAGPQADPGLAAGSCPRPYLEGCCGGGVTSQDLHVLGQAAFLTAAVVCLALAACTRLHQRRRNAFLLLRAGLDAAVYLAMTLPLPLPRWPAPLLGLPQTWLDINRRTGLHWLVFGLCEPLMFQLSPYLQAIQALIFMLPLTLIGYHSSGCRWRPALRFGFGHALLALAVSAATDARSRVLYLHRARGGAGKAALN